MKCLEVVLKFLLSQRLSLFIKIFLRTLNGGTSHLLQSGLLALTHCGVLPLLEEFSNDT